MTNLDRILSMISALTEDRDEWLKAEAERVARDAFADTAAELDTMQALAAASTCVDRAAYRQGVLDGYSLAEQQLERRPA